MVYALVRMGMGGVCVDNVSSGGMYAPVNEHGQLYRPAFCDKTGKYYQPSRHRHGRSPASRSPTCSIRRWVEPAHGCPARRPSGWRRTHHVRRYPMKYISGGAGTWLSHRTAPCWWRETTCPATTCARTPGMWTRACCPGSRSCWADPSCNVKSKKHPPSWQVDAFSLISRPAGCPAAPAAPRRCCRCRGCAPPGSSGSSRRSGARPCRRRGTRRCRTARG